ncbi:MAG: preprotein translocase subunit SecG [Nitrospirae bacterium]|nr:preprotein translocase subunit SecG [Nitrospirota bacterium]
MSTLLTILHVTACFLMVGIILLQQGKGADIGAAFGGGSHTLFGGRGATSFLAKVTIGCAAVFMVTSISLAVAAKNRAAASVIDDLGETKDFFSDQVAPVAIPDAPKQAPAPAEPAAP